MQPRSVPDPFSLSRCGSGSTTLLKAIYIFHKDIYYIMKMFKLLFFLNVTLFNSYYLLILHFSVASWHANKHQACKYKSILIFILDAIINLLIIMKRIQRSY